MKAIIEISNRKYLIQTNNPLEIISKLALLIEVEKNGYGDPVYTTAKNPENIKILLVPDRQVLIETDAEETGLVATLKAAEKNESEERQKRLDLEGKVKDLEKKLEEAAV